MHTKPILKTTSTTSIPHPQPQNQCKIHKQQFSLICLHTSCPSSHRLLCLKCKKQKHLQHPNRILQLSTFLHMLSSNKMNFIQNSICFTLINIKDKLVYINNFRVFILQKETILVQNANLIHQLLKRILGQKTKIKSLIDYLVQTQHNKHTDNEINDIKKFTQQQTNKVLSQLKPYLNFQPLHSTLRLNSQPISLLKHELQKHCESTSRTINDIREYLMKIMEVMISQQIQQEDIEYNQQDNVGSKVFNINIKKPNSQQINQKQPKYTLQILQHSFMQQLCKWQDLDVETNLHHDIVRLEEQIKLKTEIVNNIKKITVSKKHKKTGQYQEVYQDQIKGKGKDNIEEGVDREMGEQGASIREIRTNSGQVKLLQKSDQVLTEQASELHGKSNNITANNKKQQLSPKRSKISTLNNKNSKIIMSPKGPKSPHNNNKISLNLSSNKKISTNLGNNNNKNINSQSQIKIKGNLQHKQSVEIMEEKVEVKYDEVDMVNIQESINAQNNKIQSNYQQLLKDLQKQVLSLTKQLQNVHTSLNLQRISYNEQKQINSINQDYLQNQIKDKQIMEIQLKQRIQSILKSQRKLQKKQIQSAKQIKQLKQRQNQYKKQIKELKQNINKCQHKVKEEVKMGVKHKQYEIKYKKQMQILKENYQKIIDNQLIVKRKIQAKLSECQIVIQKQKAQQLKVQKHNDEKYQALQQTQLNQLQYLQQIHFKQLEQFQRKYENLQKQSLNKIQSINNDIIQLENKLQIVKDVSNQQTLILKEQINQINVKNQELQIKCQRNQQNIKQMKQIQVKLQQQIDNNHEESQNLKQIIQQNSKQIQQKNKLISQFEYKMAQLIQTHPTGSSQRILQLQQQLSTLSNLALTHAAQAFTMQQKLSKSQQSSAHYKSLYSETNSHHDSLIQSYHSLKQLYEQQINLNKLNKSINMKDYIQLYKYKQLKQMNETILKSNHQIKQSLALEREYKQKAQRENQKIKSQIVKIKQLKEKQKQKEMENTIINTSIATPLQLKYHQIHQIFLLISSDMTLLEEKLKESSIIEKVYLKQLDRKRTQNRKLKHELQECYRMQQKHHQGIRTQRNALYESKSLQMMGKAANIKNLNTHNKLSKKSSIRSSMNSSIAPSGMGDILSGIDFI